VGVCGDLQKLRNIMQGVISRIESSGWTSMGASKAVFRHNDLLALKDSLTCGPPDRTGMGRPTLQPNAEQIRIITAHYDEHGNTEGQLLARKCSVVRGRGYRWLAAEHLARLEAADQ